VAEAGRQFSIAQQLRDSIYSPLVSNFAADGFKTVDMLEGEVPSISMGHRRAANDPFPGLYGNIFDPLEALEEADYVKHTVLSVGGNDIREILGDMSQLDSVLAAFALRYPEIVRRAQAAAPDAGLILMLQYRPDVSTDAHHYGVYRALASLTGDDSGVDSGVRNLHQLMKRIYEPIFALARELRLPIIDCGRSFDINDSDLYECQIEPSVKGGALITELILHVTQMHDFDGPSQFYLKRPGMKEVEAEVNAEGHTWDLDTYWAGLKK